jgi:hypothetical protein
LEAVCDRLGVAGCIHELVNGFAGLNQEYRILEASFSKLMTTSEKLMTTSFKSCTAI